MGRLRLSLHLLAKRQYHGTHIHIEGKSSSPFGERDSEPIHEIPSPQKKKNKQNQPHPVLPLSSPPDHSLSQDIHNVRISSDQPEHARTTSSVVVAQSSRHRTRPLQPGLLPLRAAGLPSGNKHCTQCTPSSQLWQIITRIHRKAYVPLVLTRER